MIPILFDSSETEFTTNGIGRLSNATSCKVVEERNGQYELTLKYPVDGKYYSEIQNKRFIYAKPSDGKSPQPFQIYDISKPLKGIITAKAEHLSYRTSHIPVMPFTAPSLDRALQGLKNNAAEDCPFDFWTDKVVNSPYSQKVISSMRARLGGEDGSILETYKGEYEWDKWTIKLWMNRGKDNGVTIRYGKNLTDLEQEESIDGVYTGIAPYYSSTDEDDNPILVTLPEKVLHSPSADNYPYQRTIPLDLSSEFDDIPTEEQLRAAGNRYISENDIGVPKVSLNISFISLWQTEEYKDIAPLERVNLCDTVTVIFEKLGVSAKAKVVKTDYDVLLERYNSITLGDPKTNLTSTIAEVDKKTDQKIARERVSFNSEIKKASDLLSGALGGHVVIGKNADGQPNEILVMDTDSKDTAVNVIRINEAGIGFSQSGYNGPFNSAWLIDGTLDMSNINVLNLVADYITGGTLKDLATAGDRFYVNLSTGEFRVQSSGITLADGTKLDDSIDEIKLAQETAENAIDSAGDAQAAANLAREEAAKLAAGLLETDDRITEYSSALSNTTEELSSVKSSVETITGDLAEYKNQVSTQFQQTADSLTAMFTQRIDAISGQSQESSEQLVELMTYIRATAQGLELGKSNSSVRAILQNNRLSFYDGNTEVAYFANNNLYITSGTITDSMQVGSHKWISRSNGTNTTLVYTGE